jgi:ketosteroid isomerase-like protein
MLLLRGPGGILGGRMSKENVEIVRRIYDGWQQYGLWAASGDLHPAIEWINPDNAVEPGTHRGVEAFEVAWSKVSDSFETVDFQPRDYLHAGDDVVLITIMRARGHGSGADVEHPQGHVWTIKKAKAIRMRWFHQHHLALEAAGLSEQDAHADS